MRFTRLRSKNWIRLSFIIIIILFSFNAAPKQEVRENIKIPLYQVISVFNLDFNLDPIINSIELKKNTRHIIIFPSRGEIIYSGRILISSCGIEENGNVYITGAGLNKIIFYLLRKRIEWHYENGNLITGNRRIAYKAKPSSSQSRSSIYKARIKAVVIDPGHGGKDPGGIGYKGIREKDIVLKVAGYVCKYLSRKRKDVKVIMTRKKDEFISLEKRAEIANQLKDSIFISIHANVSYNKKVIGYETYYLTINPKDEISREVANKENSVINYEDVQSRKYLLDIINHIVDLEYRRESIKLAKSIQDGIKKNIGTISIDRGVKGAYFYVLKAVKMPSVLVEIGFITNRVEASHLTNTNYQKKLANGIAEGINNFIELFEETNGFTQEN